jgi:type VI secretion system protein ImpJ
MSIYNKVVWSEGLFLRPQHFQQQDRYFERYVETRCQALVRAARGDWSLSRRNSRPHAGR